MSDCYTGRVKWFNNKAGFGFLTVTDGEKSGLDVFVHHTAIRVDSNQYKYLVQGEYVEFTLAKAATSSTHEWQAANVGGIKGGKLMCETRNEAKTTRSKPAATEQPIVPKSRAPPASTDTKWTLVAKDRKPTAPRKGKQQQQQG